MAATPKKRKGSKGGLLVGSSHAEGGIKGINVTTGEPIEVEGGEVIIMKSAVDDTTLRSFEGKLMTNRQILSTINERGGGVSFSDGGEVPFRTAGNIYEYGGQFLPDFEIARRMNEGDASSYLKSRQELYRSQLRNYADGGETEILSDYEQKILALFKSGQLKYYSVTRKEAKSLNGLVDNGLAFLNPKHKQPGYVEITLTKKGEQYIEKNSFAAGGEVPGKLSFVDGVAVIKDGNRIIAKIYDRDVFFPLNNIPGTYAQDEPFSVEFGGVSRGVKTVEQAVDFIEKYNSDFYINRADLEQLERTASTSKVSVPDLIFENGETIVFEKGKATVRNGHGVAVATIFDRPVYLKANGVDKDVPENQRYGLIMADGDQRKFETLQEVAKEIKDETGVLISAFSNESVFQKARQFGERASKTGMARNTHQDAEFNEFLSKIGVRHKVGDTIPYLKAWMEGYDGDRINEGRKILDSSEGNKSSFTHYKGIHHQYANPFELNKAIEELLDSRTDSEFTAEEKAFLKYYSGYGGLGDFGATGKGLLYEYYTPTAIVEKMWGLAYKYGFSGGHVLEPSCGTGEFIQFAPDQSKVVGYEINKYSARIAKILYPQATIDVKYFEELFIRNRDSIRNNLQFVPNASRMDYSLIIGNPPYGTFDGIYAGMGEKTYTKATNYIDYFIRRGLDLLAPGGLLIFIVGAEVAAGGVPFLDQKRSGACKETIANMATLVDAYRLPNGVFERTDVVTDIIVLKKKAVATKPASTVPSINKAIEARKDKALDKPINASGRVWPNRREWLQHLKENGRVSSIAEVPAVKYDRVKYNRMNWEEQKAYDKRLEEKKTEYRIGEPDGSFFEVSKSEYDYFNSL